MDSIVALTSEISIFSLFVNMALFLWLFLFILPFQFALSPAEGIDLPLIRAVSVCLILFWFWKGVVTRHLSIEWNFRSWLLLSFCFFLIVSVLVAEETSWAVRKLLFFVSFFPLYFVFSEFLRSGRERATFLARAFVFGALGSAGVGLIQFWLQFFVSVEALFSFWTRFLLPFFLGKTFGSVVAEYPSLLVHVSGATVMRASAFFPDPHMHAFFLGLALPLAVFFAWRERSVFWVVLAILIFTVDLLTFSRGAYLGLLVASCGVAVCFFGSWSAWLKQVLSGLALLFLFIVTPNPIMDRLWSGFSMDDSSVSTRLVLYREAIERIRVHPVFGVGLGNYPLVVKPSAGEREPIYVHNLWLDMAVEIGLGGAFFLALFYFLTIRTIHGHWRQTKNGFSLAIFASLLIFFGHSLVETPIFSVQVLPAWLFILALGNTRYGTE